MNHTEFPPVPYAAPDAEVYDPGIYPRYSCTPDFFMSKSGMNDTSLAVLSIRKTKRQAIGLFLVAIIFFVGGSTYAQTKQTQHVNQIWTGYFNQTRFNNQWGVWADVHLRTKEDIVADLSQGILRLGLTYYLKDDLKLTAGYAYVNHFPAENHKNISQPEHRPWQQLQWHTRYPKLRLMQWLRLEERWRRKILNDDALADNYSFNFRVRYNFFSQFPLSKKHFQPRTFSLVFNDEVHVNFGRQIINNYFDQNRFFAGFAYHINKHDNFQFGYMNVFQQLPAGNRYRSNHVARLFYFHNLGFEKTLNLIGSEQAGAPIKK